MPWPTPRGSVRGSDSRTGMCRIRAGLHSGWVRRLASSLLRERGFCGAALSIINPLRPGRPILDFSEISIVTIAETLQPSLEAPDASGMMPITGFTRDADGRPRIGLDAESL